MCIHVKLSNYVKSGNMVRKSGENTNKIYIVNLDTAFAPGVD